MHHCAPVRPAAPAPPEDAPAAAVGLSMARLRGRAKEALELAVGARHRLEPVLTPEGPMASAAGLRAKGLGTPLTIEIDEVADLLEQTNGALLQYPPAAGPAMTGRRFGDAVLLLIALALLAPLLCAAAQDIAEAVSALRELYASP